jgi:hypothetical protein
MASQNPKAIIARIAPTDYSVSRTIQPRRLRHAPSRQWLDPDIEISAFHGTRYSQRLLHYIHHPFKQT